MDKINAGNKFFLNFKEKKHFMLVTKKKQHYNIYILIQLFTFCVITTDNWLKSYLDLQSFI